MPVNNAPDLCSSDLLQKGWASVLHNYVVAKRHRWGEATCFCTKERKSPCLPRPLGPSGGGAPAGYPLTSSAPWIAQNHPQAFESRPLVVVHYNQLLNFQKICELILKSSGTQNWPWWKYLHYRNQQTLQTGALPTWFILRAHLPVYHWSWMFSKLLENLEGAVTAGCGGQPDTEVLALQRPQPSWVKAENCTEEESSSYNPKWIRKCLLACLPLYLLPASVSRTELWVKTCSGHLGPPSPGCRSRPVTHSPERNVASWLEFWQENCKVQSLLLFPLQPRMAGQPL